MADLTASGVTLLDAWSAGGVNGKRQTVLKLDLVLAGAGSGAASNKIPASALGMSTIEEVSSLVKSDGLVIVPATPNIAGTEIILGGGASNANASYTGTFRCVVKGQTAPFNS
jgi:hypothetical protein